MKMKISKISLTPKNKKVITGTVVALIGLFILLYPGSSLITLCTIGGVGVLLLSIGIFIKYFSKKNNRKQPLYMVTGVLTLILGFILLLHPEFLISVFPFIIGAAIVSYGISAFISRKGKSIFSKIFAVIIVFFGASLMFNPFKGATTITSIIGFGLVLWGIITIILQFLTKKPLTIKGDVDENGYKEVDFRDVI